MTSESAVRATLKKNITLEYAHQFDRRRTNRDRIVRENDAGHHEIRERKLNVIELVDELSELIRSNIGHDTSNEHMRRHTLKTD
jgi:hypothetical protein